MFKDIRNELVQRPEIRELLGYAAIPTGEEEDELLEHYASLADWHLYGYEDEGLIVGIAGFVEQADGELKLQHLAVLPENRHKGYARGMLLELIKERELQRMTATTDEEGAQFFRQLGFAVYITKDAHTGLEHYRCVYEVELD